VVAPRPRCVPDGRGGAVPRVRLGRAAWTSVLPRERAEGSWPPGFGLPAVALQAFLRRSQTPASPPSCGSSLV
jgi:hypothetical protein